MKASLFFAGFLMIALTVSLDFLSLDPGFVRIIALICAFGMLSAGGVLVLGDIFGVTWIKRLNQRL